MGGEGGPVREETFATRSRQHGSVLSAHITLVRLTLIIHYLPKCTPDTIILTCNQYINYWDINVFLKYFIKSLKSGGYFILTAHVSSDGIFSLEIFDLYLYFFKIEN